MLVDIVIRAKNGHEMTQKCIDSINDNTDIDKYRIILVDDGSDPPLDVEGVDFTVRCEESYGAVTASNLGIAIGLSRTDAKYLMILDNDTRIPDGDISWLDRFIHELEESPEIAVVGATSNYANPPQHILMAPQTYTRDWEDPNTRRLGYKANLDSVWFVSFACLFKKQVLKELGPWDERYNPGNYEDTDYAVAIRSCGYKIKVARSVYIFHDGHATFKNDIEMLLKTNMEKFYKKWGAGRLFDMGMIPIDGMKAMIDAQLQLNQENTRATTSVSEPS
jgi:GT2 family glycosyltransferase